MESSLEVATRCLDYGRQRKRNVCVAWTPGRPGQTADFRPTEVGDMDKKQFLHREPWRIVGIYDYRQVSVDDLAEDIRHFAEQHLSVTMS